MPKENHLLPVQFVQQKSPVEGAGQVMMEPGLGKCRETLILPLSNVTLSFICTNGTLMVAANYVIYGVFLPAKGLGAAP